jgi:hypothetical protein
MTWFDLLILALVVLVIVLEARREAGHSMLDAVAGLAALNFAGLVAAPVTAWLNWKPFPGTEVSPGAFGVSFLVLLLLGLLAASLVHRRTRWSMEHYDLAFSMVFGLVVAVTAGHVLADVTARNGVLRGGEMPAYIQDSVVAEELRSFHTYHYVINTFEEMRYRGD